MTQPIFVLGKQRSGTTWLANLLCEHSLIAGIQHERHFGIHESAYFSHIVGRYGDIRNVSNYIEMVEVLAASDYFRLARADLAYLLSLWPTTYEALFRSVMDRYAEMQDAKYWVEKTPTHSVYVERIAAAYPDAAFLAVVRDLDEVVASTVRLNADPRVTEAGIRRWAYIVRTACSWAYYNAVLRRFASRSSRILILDYASLKSNLDVELGRVCNFLGVAFETSIRKSAYAPNTSFRNDSDREGALRKSEVWLGRTAAASAKQLPHGVVLRWDLSHRERARRPLPPWFFRLLPVSLGESQEGTTVSAALLPSLAGELSRDR